MQRARGERANDKGDGEREVGVGAPDGGEAMEQHGPHKHGGRENALQQRRLLPPAGLVRGALPWHGTRGAHEQQPGRADSREHARGRGPEVD